MATDITQQAYQDEIAESLLGPVTEQPEQLEPYFDDSVDLLNDAITEQNNDPVVLGDEEIEARHPREAQPEPREREPRETHETEQEQPEQAATITAAQIEEGIGRLDAAVKEYGLNDEGSRRELAAGFCESFGTTVDQAEINVEAFGNVTAKTMLSTWQIYKDVEGDLSKLPEIPEHSAKVWMHELLTSFNVDPRTVPANASYAARTVQGALFSVLNAVNSLGGSVTDVRRINSPEASEFYYGHFIKAITGVDPPAHKTEQYKNSALKWADTFAKYAIQFDAKMSQIAARQSATPAKRTASRGQRIPAGMRDGIRGGKAPRFNSNRDIFDAGTMDFFRQQHGRL